MRDFFYKLKKFMKILFFGDIFGRPGRNFLKDNLLDLKKKHKPDFVIANVENMAHGRGVTKNTLNELNEIGIFDAYTSGDHIWDTEVAKELVKDSSNALLRPHNLSGKQPGKGHMVVQNGLKRLLVVNLIGEVFMDKLEASSPFHGLDNILDMYTIDPEEEEKELIDGIFVDFHAEATSEKRVLGFYADGRVSVLAGTHTHVPTSDEQILPKGTAYVTDVGMVGPYNSSIGLDATGLIEEYLTGVKQKREIGDDPSVEIGAIVVELGKDGLAKNIEHIREIITLD